jgi:hypothetical protein
VAERNEPADFLGGLRESDRIGRVRSVMRLVEGVFREDVGGGGEAVAEAGAEFVEEVGWEHAARRRILGGTQE